MKTKTTAKAPNPEEWVGEQNKPACKLCNHPEAAEWVRQVVAVAEAKGKRIGAQLLANAVREHFGVPMHRDSVKRHVDNHGSPDGE